MSSGGASPILVVEDNTDLREALSEVLRDEGFAVESAATGTRALERLQRAPAPSLVLLDLMMPGRSGYDVLAAIRANPDLKGMFVGVLTASGGNPEGADIIVRKPVTVDALLDIVARALGRPCNAL